MRKCWGCLREIPADAALCENCGGVGDAPKLDSGTDDTPAADGPVPVREESRTAGLDRREWSLVLLATAGAAVVTLSLLMSRAVASPEAATTPDRPAAAPSEAAAGSSVPAAPKWSTAHSGRWGGNGRNTIAVELEADNRVAIWTRHVRPTLVVRCASKQAEVFVFTESAAAIELQTEDHTVRLALDGGPETAERWADSVDHDSLFAPDGAKFAQRLMGARTLQFGFTPHNAAPVTVHFAVAGLADLLRPAAKTCGLPS